MYEETAGLTVGDPIYRTGAPLSVELGPGLLGNIFDGIQRPLKDIAKMSGDVFIPRGVAVTALDTVKQWEFNPTVQVGDRVTGGDIYGTCPENTLIDHKLMLAPGAMGNVTYIAERGNYTVDDEVIEVEFNGKRTKYSMKQLWPVRTPRPVAKKYLANTPLLTGQRVWMSCSLESWAGPAPFLAPSVAARRSSPRPCQSTVTPTESSTSGAVREETRWPRSLQSSPLLP